MKQKRKWEKLENLNKESFKNWVFKKNQKDVAYWDNWIEKHPEKLEAVHDAMAVVLGINFTEIKISKKELDMAWQKFLITINNADQNQ